MSNAINIRIYCPRLIRGIIRMHDFAYGETWANDTTVAKRVVLRYIGVHLGTWYPTAQESEYMEIMSYNSGAVYAPEDAIELLDMIYNVFGSIIGVDCTLDSLMVIGEVDTDAQVGIADIHRVAEVSYTDVTELLSRWETGTAGAVGY